MTKENNTMNELGYDPVEVGERARVAFPEAFERVKAFAAVCDIHRGVVAEVQGVPLFMADLMVIGSATAATFVNPTREAVSS